MPLPSKPLPHIDMQDRARFWSKVEFTDGCWEWTAGTFHSGYGKFRLRERNITAHRFVWVDLFGEPKQGLVIDHICNNRSCVAPDHLRLLTNGQNIGRAVGRTHCPQGHPYAGANLRINSRGSKVCVTCQREAGRKHDAKRRKKR